MPTAAFQADPALFWRTVATVVGMFGAGALIVLALGRFDLQRILRGELGARYIGWLALTPIYLLALTTNAIIGLALTLIAMTLCIVEYSRATQLNRAAQLFLLLVAVLTIAAVVLRPALFVGAPVLVLFALTIVPIVTNRPRMVERALPLILYGYIYTTWTLAHGLLMLALPSGNGLLLVALAGCALADIGAYIVGKRIGRTVIAPSINPNKAYEGLLGNLLGATIAMVLFRYALPSYGLPALAGLTLLIAVGSAWGDILSSLAKREADIKDWGTIIPGHGGLLDRLNSFIVVMPLLYYAVVLFLPPTG